MVRFVAVYPVPTDVEEFERHYFDVHVPLAKRLPGLRNYTVSREVTTLRGPEPCHFVAELDWDDMDSLRRDFESELGRETARDLDKLQKLCPAVRTMIFEYDTP
jgi:uncharacterized protein (TIGR02118 family)